MRILIIGAQGYLGSYLGNYLTKNNYICDGLDSGFFKEGILADQLNFKIFQEDVRGIKESKIKQYDCVVMLAGISNDPFGNLNPNKIYDPTTKYALEVAKICKKYKIKFIFPSSCSVYGYSEVAANENSAVNPLTPYSQNKIDIEKELISIQGDGFYPIILRFATIFGLAPIMRFDLVINMLCGMALTKNEILLNSNGMAWRPHLHIEDACNAIMCAIKYNNLKTDIFNVGTNANNIKIIDVANIIKDKLGCEVNFLNKSKVIENNKIFIDKKIQDGHDKRNYIVDFDKINNFLPNFHCKWTVENGINDFIKKLKKIKLTQQIFEKKEFYRVPFLEFLLTNKFLNTDLYWNN